MLRPLFLKQGEAKEKAMLNFDHENGIDRMEMLKWISERNRHVPATDLAFMLGVSLLEPDDEDDDFDWE